MWEKDWQRGHVLVMRQKPVTIACSKLLCSRHRAYPPLRSILFCFNFFEAKSDRVVQDFFGKILSRTAEMQHTSEPSEVRNGICGNESSCASGQGRCKVDAIALEALDKTCIQVGETEH